MGEEKGRPDSYSAYIGTKQQTMTFTCINI